MLVGITIDSSYYEEVFSILDPKDIVFYNDLQSQHNFLAEEFPKNFNVRFKDSLLDMASRYNLVPPENN